jgi:hypothetical protein
MVEKKWFKVSFESRISEMRTSKDIQVIYLYRIYSLLNRG